MTIDEITTWRVGAQFIVTDWNETDSNGNHYARDIFKKDGQLFSLEYINGKPDLLVGVKPMANDELIQTNK